MLIKQVLKEGLKPKTDDFVSEFGYRLHAKQKHHART